MLINRYKILISILAGVISLFLNFAQINVGEGIYQVNFMMGFVFPLVISLAWGPKYGLLSAVFGCLTPIHFWYPSGLSMIITVGLLVLWIVYHGAMKQAHCKFADKPWGIYLIEIPFRIVAFFLVAYGLNLLAQFNPPEIFSIELTNYVPISATLPGAIKRLINAYVILVCADVLLLIPSVRRLLKIEKEIEEISKMKSIVISISVFVGALFWILDTMITCCILNQELGFIQALATDIPVHNLYFRMIFSIVVLVVAIVVSNLLKSSYNKNTELKNTQKLVKESEIKYKSLFENMTSGFALHRMIYDENGDPESYEYIEANPAFEKLTGLDSTNIAGKNIKQLIPDIEDHWIQAFGSVAKTGVSKYYKDYVEGLGRYYETYSFAPFKDHFAVVFNDITEQIEKSRKLEENEEKLRIAFQNIGDAIVVFDENLNVTMINEAAADVIHWCPEFCVGKHASDVFTSKNFQYDGQTMEDILLEVISTKGTLSIDDAIFHCDGKRLLCDDHDPIDFYIEDSVSPIIDNQGEIRGAVIVFRDVTEKVEFKNKTKKLEEQLIQSQKMEALGQFSGGIAHDFNNIVTAINGYTDLALELNENEKINKYLTNVKAAGERSTELTKKILQFSRKQIIKTEIIDINKTIDIFLDLTSRITGEDILVKTIYGSSNRISANVNQIERIILNLLSNAKDAINAKTQIAAEKEIIIKTSDIHMNEENLKGDFVEISVSDSGIGIRKEDNTRIFEPFFTTKEKNEGSGMGLATVHGIVHQNGASIKVESVFGEGSTFRIYWPVSNEEKIIIGDNIRSSNGSGREEIKKVILFVEDENSLRDLASEFLIEKGFVLYTAENGLDALEKYNFSDIDLIITDVIMPKMNGKEFIDEVKKIDETVDVIYTSGYTEKHIVENGILDKGIEFIAKPYNLKNLLEKIDEILGNTRN